MNSPEAVGARTPPRWCARGAIRHHHLRGSAQRASWLLASRTAACCPAYEPAAADKCAKLGNAAALCLSMLATLVGLFCLGAILWTLIARGISGMSLQLFTQMTPPPGSAEDC